MAPGQGKVIAGSLVLAAGLYLRVAEDNLDGGRVYPLLGAALAVLGAYQWSNGAPAGPSRVARVRSEVFVPEAFVATVAALLVAPFLARADIFHSYAPFLLLRLWMAGFSLYAIALARAAGGFRRLWAWVYGPIGIVFLFVRGLEVEQWAIIDFAVAGLIVVSTIFLRTEPAGASGTGAA